MPDRANQVFLSYSRNDLAAANALRQTLVQAGLAVGAYGFFRTSEHRAGSHSLPRDYIWKDIRSM